jgi:hypothetical protein
MSKMFGRLYCEQQIKERGRHSVVLVEAALGNGIPLLSTGLRVSRPRAIGLLPPLRRSYHLNTCKNKTENNECAQRSHAAVQNFAN